MNERIQELIGQCIDQRWTVTGPMFDKEKFAELIVRESGKYLMSPEFIGRSDLNWDIVLKEHFGVNQ
jgi:hypothetical protein